MQIPDTYKKSLARIEAFLTPRNRRRAQGMIKIAIFAIGSYYLYNKYRELKGEADKAVKSFREEEERNRKRRKEQAERAIQQKEELKRQLAESKRLQEEATQARLALEERTREAERLTLEAQERERAAALKREQERQDALEEEANFQATCSAANFIAPIWKSCVQRMRWKKLVPLVQLQFEADKRQACQEVLRIFSAPKKTIPYRSVRKERKEHLEHAQCLRLLDWAKVRQHFLTQQEISAAQSEKDKALKLEKQRQAELKASEKAKHGGFLAVVGGKMQPIEFAPVDDISDPTRYYFHKEALTLDVLIREYKYFRMRQIGAGRPEFKRGIPTLTPEEFAKLEGELNYFRSKSTLPIDFMTSSYSDQRKEVVLKQFKYLRHKEKAMKEGTWNEELEKSSKDAARTKLDNGKKKSTIQQRASVPSSSRLPQKQKQKIDKKGKTPMVSVPTMPIVPLKTIMDEQAEEDSPSDFQSTKSSLQSSPSVSPLLTFGALQPREPFRWDEEEDPALMLMNAKARKEALANVCIFTESRKLKKGTGKKEERPDGDYGRGGGL